MATGAGPQGSLIVLWAGEDPALHSALLEELEEAGIPYIDKPTGEDAEAGTDILPIDWKARFGFEVAVASSSLAAAEKILEKLLDEEPVDMEIPAEDEAGPAAEAVPGHLTAATSAVWTGAGEEQERAEFLSQALKENEIPVRVEVHGSETTLYVPPEEETLAREIIREIVEGAPPA